MNKTILLTICLFAAVCLQGQVNENGFVIRLDGNYNETTTSNLLQYINVYGAKSKDGNISVSTGYLCQNWLFGLGFEYIRNKSNVFGNVTYKKYVTGYNDIIEYNTSLEANTVNLNGYGGVFYISRYLPVWRNLYFTPGFYVGCGNIKRDNSGIVGFTQLFAPDIGISIVGPLSFASIYKKQKSSEYFYMQLSPELTWFFSKRFGLNIQMGGLGINIIDSDWKNSSKQINFNPAFWKLGVLFKL